MAVLRAYCGNDHGHFRQTVLQHVDALFFAAYSYLQLEQYECLTLKANNDSGLMAFGLMVFGLMILRPF